MSEAGSDFREAGVPSPCIKVCQLDPVTRICAGCQRHVDEIARWRDADDETRRAILARAAKRRACTLTSST